MDGFQEFEARRRKKFDKQIDSNVMISSKGLDEGVDPWDCSWLVEVTYEGGFAVVHFLLMYSMKAKAFYLYAFYVTSEIN